MGNILYYPWVTCNIYVEASIEVSPPIIPSGEEESGRGFLEQPRSHLSNGARSAAGRQRCSAAAVAAKVRKSSSSERATNGEREKSRKVEKSPSPREGEGEGPSPIMAHASELK